MMHIYSVVAPTLYSHYFYLIFTNTYGTVMKWNSLDKEEDKTVQSSINTTYE